MTATSTPTPTSGGLAAPTVTLDVASIGSGFTGDAVTVSWVNGAYPVSYVDFSTDPNFGTSWNKWVGGTTSTKLPTGFSNGASVSGGTTYYVRLWDGHNHSPATAFTVPTSASSATAVSSVTATPTRTPVDQQGQH